MILSSAQMTLLAPAALTSALLFGCQDDRTEAAVVAPIERAAHYAEEDENGVPQLNDSEIVGVLATANEAEIVHGHLVATKLKDDTLRSYAGDMIKAHTQAQVGLSRLTVEQSLVVEESPFAEALGSEDGAVASTLELLPSGVSLDRKYAMAEVSHHRDILELIDNVLLPQAQANALKSELRDARTRTAQHLKRADRLATELGGDARASL